MRGFTKLPKDYSDKYTDKPVRIIPFNPKSKQVANEYIKKIRSLLLKYKVNFLLRGSTAYEIAGKGEIEIGVYPKEKEWKEVLGTLKSHFGTIDNLEENYARFNNKLGGFEIEVILLKGHDAVIDKKLTEYLKNSPELLQEYEKIKRKYSYSKREYMIHKNDFLEGIVKKLK